MASSELIQTLEEIARIKESLPSRARGWCSELGLYVQMREMRGMTSLKAGGKFRSRIELWREYHRDSWQVKKYRSGEWEVLAESTLKLAKWLVPRGGVAATVKAEFRHAIKAFRSTGHLVLPEGIGSFPDDSVLGRIVSMYPVDFQYWDDTMLKNVEDRLLSYIELEPSQAAAWHALSIVYTVEGRFKNSLDTIEKAISIAPDQVQFHHEASSFYLSAIQLAVTPETASNMLGPVMGHCTLDALGRTYEEAKASCTQHLEAILALSRSYSDNRREKALEALHWLRAGAGGYEAVKTDDRSLHMSNSVNYHEDSGDSESSFCEYLTAGALRAILDSKTAPSRKVEMDVAINLTVFQLLLGMSMARRYPDKAKTVLIKERLPSPPGGLDLRLMYQHSATLAGLRGEEALFSSIEQDFNANFDRYEREGKGGSWILMYVLMRLMPLSSLDSMKSGADIDLDLLTESLFGAMKDGIGYILFLPRESLLREFEDKLKGYYVGGTELVDTSLDQALETYEKTYGVI